MKRARFMAAGQYHEGHATEEGLFDEGGRRHDPDAVVWLPPVQPTKILAVALNYSKHAEELGLERPEEPAFFFKPLTALVGHRGGVVYPAGVQFMHYEVELAVVIGRRCRKVSESRALEVVRGYTIGNDLVVRDFVKNTFRPPVKAKGFDTFCPLGPYLVEGEIADPMRVGLRTYVNGELKQEGNTANLTFSISELIAYLTGFMTLEAGDVILTGTPEGVSPVHAGDVMRLEADGLGCLENPVVEETSGLA